MQNASYEVFNLWCRSKPLPMINNVSLIIEKNLITNYEHKNNHNEQTKKQQQSKRDANVNARMVLYSFVKELTP